MKTPVEIDGIDPSIGDVTADLFHEFAIADVDHRFPDRISFLDTFRSARLGPITTRDHTKKDEKKNRKPVDSGFFPSSIGY